MSASPVETAASTRSRPEQHNTTGIYALTVREIFHMITSETRFPLFEQDMIAFAQKLIRIKSMSGEEGPIAQCVKSEMEKLGYEGVTIDAIGNVVGRLGHGKASIHFDSHMDTVEVNDADKWDHPPFSGEIHNGYIWGRGSVDMKSALCASIYGAALAKALGHLEGKTVYVTASVCEESCDGENLKSFYKEFGLKPDYCIICEPSNNVITLGHKGKAQVRVTARGISAHGSAPEKGKNAVYEMAGIISRVEALNQKLRSEGPEHGTVVLSDISCVSASFNAVPSACSIYLDRRLAAHETLEQIKLEMDALVDGKDAHWEIGTLHCTSWTGKAIAYQPMHDPWSISAEHPLIKALERACEIVRGDKPHTYNFWDFSTNAITPVAMGIPTVGFGPGEYKLAHMRNECCSVEKIKEACLIYAQLIKELE